MSERGLPPLMMTTRRGHKAASTLASLRRLHPARVDEPARLPPPERGVVAALGEELVVRALLDDAPAIEHHEPVHARDRGQPVRDRDDGLSRHQHAEAL